MNENENGEGKHNARTNIRSKKNTKEIFTHYETFDFNTRKMVCGNHLSVCRINFQIHLNYLFKKRLLYVRLKKKSVVLAGTNQNEQQGGSLKPLILSQHTFG